jgi:hypothetical protein
MLTRRPIAVAALKVAERKRPSGEKPREPPSIVAPARLARARIAAS